jgi:CheY-like chemotaxis protein
VFADAKRLQQVLKNLLSNAFKFTHEGNVTLTMEPAEAGWDPENEDLSRSSEVIAVSVSDTGIGISADKQQIIFEAFQQADGSTSRKYGGTGLGLAISRELSRLLGGEIRLTSTPGQGSTFTLYIPAVYVGTRALRKFVSARDTRPGGIALRSDTPRPMVYDTPALAPPPQPARLVNEIGDDRDTISLHDRVVLIVENDLAFARFVLDAAREKGFKGIATSQGVSALALAAEYKPAAITLDIFLPDIDGWRVLERLKNDPQTRHIPVAVISTEEARERALGSGAFDFVVKPIQSKEALDVLIERIGAFIARGERSLLIVSPDPTRRDSLCSYLRADDVQVLPAENYQAAVEALAGHPVDCVVLDSMLPPPAGGTLDGDTDLVASLAARPVVIYNEGNGEDSERWSRFVRHAVVREAHTPARVLDHASFFMHRAPARMPDAHRDALRQLYDADDSLKGRKAMVVDDDMRNIFALTSLLEDRGMQVVSHDNGRDAIDALRQQPDVDVVLMDIMMPEMDGIDTIREIRRIPECKNVPIIAVTAKAMKGDREKCMEAGAWDYLAKPVDTDLMVGTLRAWLRR